MGATPSQVTALIVRHSTAIVVAGIAVGVGLAAGTARLLRALLFGVAPGEWTIPALVAVSTLAVATLACWWPAWRAARINPMRALRGG
jgi:putative ABC transport system permease protein